MRHVVLVLSCTAALSACRPHSDGSPPPVPPASSEAGGARAGHAGQAATASSSDAHGSSSSGAAGPGAPSANAHAGHAAPSADTRAGPPAPSAEPAAAPTGYAAIQLEPSQARAMNLTTAVVEERRFDRTLRTVGVVAVDETRTSHVHAKVRGFIESLTANYVGREIKRGQALCTIYSQDVLAAEVEFLAVLDRSPRAGSSQGEFADMERTAREQILAAARRRLQLWDVPKAEIERLERTREPRRTFTLSAPRSGVVVAKQALEGIYVDPSVELFVIADLSRVWALVDIYEADVPFVKLGDYARLSFAGREGPPLHAPATFLAPTLDEATRTLKLRFELDNRDGRLRPGTFATVEMDLAIARSLGVPESAVIRTGARSVVFVVHGTHVEPREVRLGVSAGGFYRVESGVSAGEQVATGAQFLLDSESRLRATSSPGAGHVH